MLGLLLAAVAVPEEDLVYYQEVDFVLTRERMVTIRKTPGLTSRAYEPTNIAEVCEAQHNGESPGMIAYYLTDDIAERYIDLLDDIDEEIDEIEEGVDTWPAEEVRAPDRGAPARSPPHPQDTRADARRGARDRRRPGRDRRPDAVLARGFPAEIERQFSTTYDKLLRAAEAIEFARDLLSAVRDYQQARVSIDQNEVTSG